MYKGTLFIVLVLLLASFAPQSFKKDQLQYPRVRQAYKDKGESMKTLLKSHGLKKEQLRLYLRAFKSEKKIELWAKNLCDEKFQLVKTYSICATCGSIGPKREQGDLQIPEGFYHINRFNPHSQFYLSLGINYPNKSDKILGKKGQLGGDIYIHGNCVTLGCMPIRNGPIKELYILCVEAKNNGQAKIPVTIFPTRLSKTTFERLKQKHATNNGFIDLWTDLKIGYDTFNQTKKLPSVTFLNNGRHKVKD